MSRNAVSPKGSGRCLLILVVRKSPKIPGGTSRASSLSRTPPPWHLPCFLLQSQSSFRPVDSNPAGSGMWGAVAPTKWRSAKSAPPRQASTTLAHWTHRTTNAFMEGLNPKFRS